MNSYKTDLENIEKRLQLRSRWLLLEAVYFYFFVFLVAFVLSSFLGFWLSLIPMIVGSFVYSWKVTPKVESYIEKLCKTRYPLSSERNDENPI